MLSSQAIPDPEKGDSPADTGYIDPARCPICGAPNQCQRCIEGPDMRRCWCHELRIPRSVFELIPAEAINRACVCRPCLMRLGATVMRRRSQTA